MIYSVNLKVRLFSFLIGNSDMDLKNNFSLLREDSGTWRLSDEFSARFKQLVRANLNRINVKF